MLHIVGTIVMVVAGVSSAAAKQPELQGQRMDHIRQIIDGLSRETLPMKRLDLTKKLAVAVRESAAEVDPSIAGELARFLGDPQDEVRYWVAMALSYMGPKAESAIPALEKALEERKGRDQGKTSASAIRLALQKISKKPRPRTRQPSR